MLIKSMTKLAVNIGIKYDLKLHFYITENIK